MRQFRIGLAGIFIIALTLSFFSAVAQQTNSVAGVDNSKFGTYRALAELAFEAFQKSDEIAAAKAARILERSWDRCEAELAKSSPGPYEEIDSAMDEFIKPLIKFKTAKPDPSTVEKTYRDYQEKLKKAEQALQR
jgi:hypothetical protein